MIHKTRARSFGKQVFYRIRNPFLQEVFQRPGERGVRSCGIVLEDGLSERCVSRVARRGIPCVEVKLLEMLSRSILKLEMGVELRYEIPSRPETDWRLMGYDVLEILEVLQQARGYGIN